MKRGLLVLITFLLTIASVSALEVTYDNVQSESLPGDKISYLLHLKNNEDSSLELKFRSPDLNWLLDQEGMKLTIAPGQTKDYSISFKPLSGNKILAGNYIVRIIVSTQLTNVEKLLTAQVLGYREVLDVNFATDTVIDPRRGTIIKLYVKNKNLVNLNNLDLELSSEHFKFTKTLSLGRSEDTILEFPVKLDPDTLRGNYETNVKISLGNNLMIDKLLSYSVQEYQELKQLTLPETRFLLTGETVTFAIILRDIQ